MGDPLVSVIVPCYNHERYVGKSILSVIEQPYKNIELIVIDDGSKDSTAKIVKDLAETYGFYCEIHKINQGICRTLNKAITLSTGKYLKFLASDDFIHDQSITEFVDHMESHPDVDVCFGDLIKIDKDGKQVGFLKSGIQKTFQRNFLIDNAVDISADMAIQSSPIIGPSYVIKKSVLKEFGPFDESLIVEDWDLFLFLVCHSKKISYIPVAAGFYRVFSVTDRPYKRSIKKQFLSDIQIISKYRNYVHDESFETGIKNLVRSYSIISILQREESPVYFLGFVKKFPFLWSFLANFGFHRQLLNAYKKNLFAQASNFLKRIKK
jgi:glycosyltransferase involved in cell wall biosynthesis